MYKTLPVPDNVIVRLLDYGQNDLSNNQTPLEGNNLEIKKIRKFDLGYSTTSLPSQITTIIMNFGPTESSSEEDYTLTSITPPTSDTEQEVVHPQYLP